MDYKTIKAVFDKATPWRGSETVLSLPEYKRVQSQLYRFGC